MSYSSATYHLIEPWRTELFQGKFMHLKGDSRMRKLHMFYLILLSVMILAACNQDRETKEEVPRTVSVDVAEVTIGNITEVKTLYGRTSPRKTTPLLTEVPGEIDEVKVENGDRVEKDDLIATVRTQAGTMRMTAPVAGEIAQFASESGDMVTPEEPLGLIIDSESMNITFHVTTRERSLLTENETYTMELEEETYEATLDQIDSLPNDNGLYDVQLSIENKDNEIIAGMIAAIDLKQTRIKDALIVPTEAVIEESNGAFVYLVKDDEVKKVTVGIQEMGSDETAIDGDIIEGDYVVVNGQLTVTDGSKVEIVKVVNES